MLPDIASTVFALGGVSLQILGGGDGEELVKSSCTGVVVGDAKPDDARLSLDDILFV